MTNRNSILADSVKASESVKGSMALNDPSKSNSK